MERTVNNKNVYPQTIYGLLQEQAELNPDHEAILSLDRSPLTYRRLLMQAEKTVKYLRAAGVRRAPHCRLEPLRIRQMRRGRCGSG